MTTPAHRSLLAAFVGRPAEPAWLGDVRRAALGRLEALGLPTVRQEDWRFTNLAALSAETFVRGPPGGGAAVLERAPLPAGPRLVFVNGRHRADLSSAAGLPAGALATTLADALARAPERVRPHLGRLALAEGHAFVAANTALFEDGAFVWLPAGAAGVTVTLVHVCEPGAAAAAAFPRTLVVAEAGAQGAIEELYLGAAGAASLTGAVTELVLGEGAKLEHLRLLAESRDAYHVGVVCAEQGAGAHLAAHAFTLGGKLSRAELRTRLAGEGAEVAANGLYLADGTQLVDNFSWVEHAVPRCTTAETYKGILDGRSRGVFSGRIVVRPGAQKTKAYQMNSNLLLSDDAVVDTKPQLEIFADDVKCGHGGTVGQLDEAALFYLRSRGLGEAEARALLMWAFAGEMVSRIVAPGLRAQAHAFVAARLPAGAAVLEAA